MLALEQHGRRQRMDYSQLMSEAYWRERAPALHVADAAFLDSQAPQTFAPDDTRTIAGLLKTEGYVQRGGMDWGVDLTSLVQIVRRLSTDALSPVFAFVYDEFWLPFRKLDAIYRALLGDRNYYLPDFWIWDVDPKRNEAGWQPHRDKGRIALLADGAPKSLTTWIAISAATTLNGCMYMVPANLDPTYNTDAEYTCRFPLQSVRALPAAAGDVLIWNQAVMHWGSMTSPRAPESRVSMAFEFQRADIAPMRQPLLVPGAVHNFQARLALIAKQMLQYQHMYVLRPEIAQLAQKLAAPLMTYS
jgi:hypothetical protein